MPSEKDKKHVTILFVDWQQEKLKNKKRFKDVPTKKERKRNGLPCPQHRRMDYEDKEWPVEHSGGRRKKKLTVSEMQHQKKKKEKLTVNEMWYQKKKDIYLKW